MKQQFSEQQSRRKQNACSRSPDKKHMPERGAKIRARQRRDYDEFRRKIRLQVLREKRLKAVNTSLEFSDVSIQTLHSICAPAASHKQAKNGHLPNISSSQSVFQQKEFGACSSKESRLVKASEMANAPPKSSNDAVEELWLEVSVEIDHGIDLVVDLNLDRSTTDWLDLERNSRMLVPPDKAADDKQRRCSSNDGADDSADGACGASGSSAEAPSTKHTTAEDDDQLPTTHDGITLDGNAGSKTVQMGLLAAACDPVESQESSTSGTKELIRYEGFSFASLERMPTFLATGLRSGPFQNESKVNSNSDWMVVCIEV